MFLLHNLILLYQAIFQTIFQKLFYYENFKQTRIQQVALNHSSDIDFKDFMNLYKKCTAKLYSCLVINDTLASDNNSLFRKNLLKKI